MKEMVQHCFKVAAKNKFLIIGIVAIPLLFAVLYVSAFWNPTDKLKDMPVAVINLDAGAAVDGAEVNYGATIVENIMEDHAVAWETVDPGVFAGGIENTDYYMAFVIDQDFSADITAAADGHPTTGQISFLVDKRKSFILAQFGNFIRANFNDQVSAAITQEYTETIYGGLKDMTESLQAAAAGSGTVSDGAESAKEGMNALAAGAQEVADGAESLSQSLSAVSGKMPSLAQGTDALYRGIASVDAGSAAVSSGMSALNEAMPVLTAGAGSLGSGLAAAAERLPAFAGGLDQIKSGAGQLAAALDGISAGAEASAASANSAIDSAIVAIESGDTESAVAILEQAKAGNSSGAANISANLGSAVGQLKVIGDNAGTLADSAAGFTGQVQIMAKGASSLNAGLTTFADQVSLLSGASSALSSGTASMYNGASDLAKGISALSAGSSQLAAGAATLSSGALSLADGASALDNGLYRLSEGTAELMASLARGASEVATNTKADTGEMAAFVGNPAETGEEIYGNVDTYGMGFSPFFVSLACWIGTVLLFFVVPLRPENPVAATRFQTVFTPMPAFVLVAVLQGLAVAVGTLLIGVNVNHIMLLCGLTVLMSVCFALINQLFNLMFGISGRGVAIVFLILQLCACGGTFPVELISDFFETVSPYMPFTYSVQALKEIMFGQDLSLILKNAAIIAAFGGGSVLLSLTVSRLGLRRDKLPA
ncbi:MAG TPA: YhgE/Pip domain-containing protein [Clostridiales bacterium]|nr:YhgE/Pip domain-containing protein [Clostridiales bacterium]